MTRFVRLLLACLLIAALPLQGSAAASMAFCASGGPVPAAVAGSHPHAHDHAAAHGHTTEAAALGASAALPDAAHACSACMACCHAIGMLPAASFTMPAPAPQDPVGAPATPPDERPASVLERPPRA